MYFPYLRARQYELLAIREALSNKLIDNKLVVPVIEPVKLNATFVSSMKKIIDLGGKVIVIINPKVGSIKKDFKQDKNAEIVFAYKDMLTSNAFTPAIIIDNENDLDEGVNQFSDYVIIINSQDGIAPYEKLKNEGFENKVFVPDETVYRRKIKYNRVLLRDNFDKRERNVEYKEIVDQPFSEDHLYYKEDDYVGFSDYSVIGKPYSESGFAPYAVAIHIVYFDNEKSLRIKHFVSDSNYDINNPAGKFREALVKLINWKRDCNLETYALKQFEYMFENDIYPGLGVVKKLAILHHLELMNRYLQENNDK